MHTTPEGTKTMSITTFHTNAERLPALPTDEAREHSDTTVHNITVSIGAAELNSGELVIWWPVSGVDHHIEAAYDRQQITLADAESRLRADLTGRGLNVAEFIDEDAKPVVSPEVADALAQMDEQEQEAREAGLWDANYERMHVELAKMFREANTVQPVLDACFQAMCNSIAEEHGLRLTRASADASDQLGGKLLVWRESGIVILPHEMTPLDALDQLRAAVGETATPQGTPAAAKA
ncbi:hypothetical protein AB0H18_00535 [Streptomyces sp. NPDC020766]|uniref:hypothetical protein n=1 Tax=Streptomyces sp. NPDC020766 TaxID=3155011 RepID=UPI0033DC4AE2